MDSCLVALIGVFSFFVVLTSIVLFGISFDTVGVHEWGIIYNHINQKIDSKPYGSGRYLAGLGKKFVKYPRDLIMIDMSSDSGAQTNSLSCWSNEGMNVFLDISLFLKIEKEKLYDLYFLYGGNWYSTLVRLSSSTIKEVTVEFNALDFFTKREDIKVKIIDSLKDKYQTYTQNAVKLIDIQLRDIDFEDSLELAIEEKLKWVQ